MAWGRCMDEVGVLRGWRGGVARMAWGRCVDGVGGGTGRGPIRTFSVPDTAIPVPHHVIPTPSRHSCVGGNPPSCIRRRIHRNTLFPTR